MTLWKVEIMKRKSNQKFCYYVGFKDLLPIEKSLLSNSQLHGDLC